MSLPLRPLVAIVGTTGTGKSKLAIELAKHYGSEVINADAMQVYEGMDIITNKVSTPEMQGVQHHLMAFRQPGQQYTVGEWVNDSVKLISDMHSRNKVPIVVGGTSYWIQHLVFPGSVNYEQPASTSDGSISPELAQSLAQLPPELLDMYNTLPDEAPSASSSPEEALSMYKLLNTLDPRMGARWHWKDTRKVHRSLCIMKDSGRLATDRVISQSETGCRPRPRYRTLFFWLYAETTAIHPRLNARVDDMLERGLSSEVQALLDLKAASGDSDFDFTTGIYQSIGYKEFYKYLTLPPQERTSIALARAVDSMKTSTRQYAKRQISWIKNKLLPEVQATNSSEKEDVVSTYLLHIDDLDDWTPNVHVPAMRIADEFLRGTLTLNPQSLSEAAQTMLLTPERETDPVLRLDASRKTLCSTCTTDEQRPFLVEAKEWDNHLRSRTHKKMIQRAEKKEKWQKYLREKGEAAGGSEDDDVELSS